MVAEFSLLLVTGVVNLILACFIYLKNRKSNVNISVSFLILNVGLWAFINAICLRTKTPKTAIFWSQVSYLNGILIGVSFFYFSLLFPPSLSTSKKSLVKRYHNIILAISLPIVSAIIFIPNFTVETVILRPWKIITGPGVYLFVIYFFLTMGWGLKDLIRKFFISRGRERLQLSYLLLGTVFTAIPGSFFNLALPILLGNYRFVWLGPIFTFVMVAFISYAIATQEMFGIKVVLTTLLVGLMAVLLSLDTLFFTEGTIFQFFKGGVLLVFLYFGYLLIKSVLQEIKRREEIEKLATSLALSEQKIKEQLEALERAHEKLKELDKMKDEFISITSHELRTPMTAVQGYLWMLQKKGGELNAKQKKYLERAQGGSERMIRLINDMLDVSRIEQERVELEIRTVELTPIIEEVVDELKIKAKKKKLKLEFLAGDRPLPPVKADAGKVRRILTNLLDNALKFTEEGGVTIEGYKKGRFVQVNVTDTGRGISKEDLPRLFKKFGRLESDFVTAAEAGGTGLGLYISRALVERMRGKISVQSTPKKGSTFSFTLPVSDLP